MEQLHELDTTITLCFTPPSHGQRPCHTSPPCVLQGYADFAEEVIRRYVLPRECNATGTVYGKNRVIA